MMKRKAAFFLATVAVALVLIVAPRWRPVLADGEGNGPVGSYLFSFLGLGPGLTVPGLATLSSDGTLISATGSDQGGPSNVFLVKNSATHGVWFKTGARSVGAHALFLNFDPGSGVVVSITKVRLAATFDKDFNNASGTFFQSIFICSTGPFTCPNPLTATPDVPESVLGARPFTAQRIQ